MSFFLQDPHVWYWLSQTVLFLLLVICAVTDLVLSKIYNAVTLPALVCGVVGNVGGAGIQGFKSSAVGLALGFGIFIIVYFFGGMGGGDVKLMSAIGAIGGYPFILWAIFFSILSGGLLSIIVMIYHGAFFRSLKNVFKTLASIVLPHRVLEPLSPENSLKIPYGFCISIGTLWGWIMVYLHKV